MTRCVLSAAGSTSTMAALVALTAVNLAMGLVRFVLLQNWVFD